MEKTSFLRNVQKLVSGTLFSQIILLLSTPVLTRLYSSEQFGSLSLFISVLGVLSVSASLRYNRAIPLPRKDNDAKLIVILGVFIVLIYSLFLLFIIIANNVFDIVTFDGITNAAYIYILPLSVFCVGMYDLCSYWGLRVESFGVLARSKVIQTLSIVTIQISLFSFGAMSLILGHFLGVFVSFIFLLFSFWSSLKSISLNWKRTIALSKRYVDFPKYSTWEALLNSSGNNFPVILLTFFLGSSVAGLYALTYKVLSLPLSIIGAAIGQAYFAKAAKSYKNGNVGDLTLKLFSVLCNVGFPPAILLMFISPYLFEVAFGSEWSQAGFYAQIMTPWLLLIFLSSPLSSIISVSEEQKKSVVFQIIFLVIKLTSVYFGSLYYDDLITVLILSLSSSILLVIFTSWLLCLASVSLVKAFIVFCKSMLFGILCNIPIIIQFVVFYGEGNNISFIIAVALVLLIMSCRLYFFKRGLSLD